ncbi:MAG: hypothetical protein QXF24_03730, partial [Thermoproteota archaeon]
MGRGKAAIMSMGKSANTEQRMKISTPFAAALLFLCLVLLPFGLARCLPAPGYDREVEADFVLGGKPVRASLAWTEPEAGAGGNSAGQQTSTGAAGGSSGQAASQQGSGMGQDQGTKVGATAAVAGAASAAALAGVGLAAKKAMGSGEGPPEEKEPASTGGDQNTEDTAKRHEDEQVKRAKSGNMGSKTDQPISTSSTPAGGEIRQTSTPAASS